MAVSEFHPPRVVKLFAGHLNTGPGFMSWDALSHPSARWEAMPGWKAPTRPPGPRVLSSSFLLCSSSFRLKHFGSILGDNWVSSSEWGGVWLRVSPLCALCGGWNLGWLKLCGGLGILGYLICPRTNLRRAVV